MDDPKRLSHVIYVDLGSSYRLYNMKTVPYVPSIINPGLADQVFLPISLTQLTTKTRRSPITIRVSKKTSLIVLHRRGVFLLLESTKTENIEEKKRGKSPTAGIALPEIKL